MISRADSLPVRVRQVPPEIVGQGQPSPDLDSPRVIFNLPGNRARNLALHVEDVRQFAVVAISRSSGVPANSG